MATTTPDSPWRDTGDTTPEAFAAELVGSPVAVEADALCDCASPYGRLYLGHSYVENRHDAIGEIVTPDMHNNLCLRPRGYPEEEGERDGFAVFPSYAACCAAWRRRLTDPALPYVGTVTMLEYSTVYNPPGDTHPGSGVPNDSAAYCDGLCATINRLPTDGGTMPDEIVFGRVPHPPADERWIPDANNTAWDNLGARAVNGVVWHRMVGTLNGTDHFFRTGASALTDYGVGVGGVDGASLDGRVYRWNDPTGAAHPGCSPHRAGWASGPWSSSGSFGDGKAFVAEYGTNAINRDQASVEISGNFDTALSEKGRDAVAGLTAYWADRAKIPWHEFPMWGDHGYSFVRWHVEFCGEAHKPCPGAVVRDETDALIERTRQVMKRYQTQAPEPPEPEPPAPGADYPEGMDKALAARWFGKVTANGKVYEYTEGQPVSALWLEEGCLIGVWPELVAVERYDTRTYFRFEGGWTLWRPNDEAPVRVLKE